MKKIIFTLFLIITFGFCHAQDFLGLSLQQCKNRITNTYNAQYDVNIVKGKYTIFFTWYLENLQYGDVDIFFDNNNICYAQSFRPFSTFSSNDFIKALDELGYKEVVSEDPGERKWLMVSTKYTYIVSTTHYKDILVFSMFRV